MYAMIYIIENAYKWTVLLKKYGKWHTIYMKFNRCLKNYAMAEAIAFFL